MSKPVDPDNPDRPPRSQAPAWECRPGGSGLRHGMAGAMQESVPRPEPGNESKMSAGSMPQGWISTKLGTILEFKYGKSLPAKSRDGDGFPVYGSNGIIGFHSQPLTKTKGIIVGRKGSLGEVNLSKKPFYPIDTTYYIDEFFEQPILYWYNFLRSLPLSELNKATAIPGLNRGDAYNLEIPIPPLAEQKQIAARLDALLAQVDTLKTRLDTIPTILKRFRQSVLAAAVSGKLTEGWRNDEEYNNGYPFSWDRKRLPELGELSRGKSKHRPRNDPKLFGNEYPFIQTGEVANSGGRIKNATKFYSEFGLAQSRLFPKKTLCITIAANIADTALLDIDACFPDSIVGFIPKNDECRVEFVKFLIDFNKSNLEEFAPATAQKNINLRLLNELLLPVPKRIEQDEIVRRVDQLFAFADQIEQRVAEAKKRVDHLTQSILAKAFRGDLTSEWRAQNPDMISGENSAEALLARIKAERTGVQASGKASKRRSEV